VLGQDGARLVEAPGQREQVQHRELGAALRVAADVAGDAGHQHAEFGRPADIDLLDSDAELLHQPERACRQHGRRQPRAERAHHIDAVEVLGDPIRRAAGDVPARQQRGQAAE